jgi:single-stranded DNA-binding protein
MFQSERFSNTLVIAGKLTRDVKIIKQPSGYDTALGTIASNTDFSSPDGRRRKTAYMQFTASGWLVKDLVSRGTRGSQWILIGYLETIDRKCKCGVVSNSQILRVERYLYPDSNPSSRPKVENGTSSLQPDSGFVIPYEEPEKEVTEEENGEAEEPKDEE